MTTTQTQKPTIPQKQDEDILVVRRNELFPEGAWQGIRAVDTQQFVTTIQEKKEFHPRSLMETDPTFKQIIPYLIFTHGNKYFLMQRQSNASEKRLQNKYSLGIGGHIRKEDMTTNSIFDWAKREFHEEVNYSGKLNISPLGVLNDDSNDVGKVHLGFVLLLQGDSNAISVKSELKSGTLVTLDECAKYQNNLESWSNLVFEFLQK